MRDYNGDVGALIPELLAKGIPMMVGSDEWGGHWQVIIGYDNMGTAGTQDDVLIDGGPLRHHGPQPGRLLPGAVRAPHLRLDAAWTRTAPSSWPIRQASIPTLS